MSDISALYTAQTRPGIANGNSPATGPAALSGGSGLFGAAGAGLSFFDLIFARITDISGKKTEGEAEILPIAQAATQNTATTPDDTVMADPALAEIIPADIAALYASQAGLPSDATIDPAPVQILAEIDPARHGKVLAVLDNLLRGLPADLEGRMIRINPGQMKNAITSLNITPPAQGENTESLIATGMTIDELNALLHDIANGTEGTAIIGLVKILPDGAKNDVIFLPRGLIINGKPADTVSGHDPARDPDGDLAAALNALVVGEGDASADAPAMATPATPLPTPAQPLPSVPPQTDGLQQNPGLPSSYDPTARTPGASMDADAEIGANQDKSIQGQQTQNTSPAGPPQTGPVNSTVSRPFAGMVGSLMNTTSLGDTFPEGMDWAQGPAGGPSNTQVSNPAQLASLVTHARHATQPHPATQMVAASLARSAQGGENQTLRLQLDPPELGRIEVHMHFSKDKTLKAHMVIEKPETMLMLQRDAQVLERALHDAGMESGENISFSLAGGDDGFSSGRDSGNNGSAGSGNKGANGTDSEIIETTMTWYVDPETGHQRYNILA